MAKTTAKAETTNLDTARTIIDTLRGELERAHAAHAAERAELLDEIHDVLAAWAAEADREGRTRTRYQLTAQGRRAA